MNRLIYISESCIEEVDQQLCVSQIVATANKNNARLETTGALLFTGTHFAQVLEGPAEVVAALIAGISKDSRHKNVRIVDNSLTSTRRFPDWKMAYFGPSQFVSCHVVRLLNARSQSEQRRASEWLADLVHEFSISQTVRTSVASDR